MISKRINGSKLIALEWLARASLSVLSKITSFLHSEVELTKRISLILSSVMTSLKTSGRRFKALPLLLTNLSGFLVIWALPTRLRIMKSWFLVVRAPWPSKSSTAALYSTSRRWKLGRRANWLIHARLWTPLWFLAAIYTPLAMISSFINITLQSKSGTVFQNNSHEKSMSSPSTP